MSPALRIVLLALAVLALSAPGAHAALAPSVTAQLTDEGSAKGWRTIRVDVSGSCGPEASPETRVTVNADLRRAPASAGGKPGTPFSRGLEPIGSTESVEATSGTFRYRVSGGWSAVAVGTISCSEPESDGAEATSPPSAAVVAPLRLEGWEAQGMSVNGGPQCIPPKRGRFRAHVGYDIAFDLGEIDARTFFGHGGTEPRMDDLGRVKFHLRGGGTMAWDKVVSRRGYRLHGRLLMGYYFQPRRPVPVTMWMSVKGVETNRLTIPVLPRKKGCRKL